MIRISSFISNFKRVLVVGLTIVVIYGVCQLLNFLYVLPEDFSRILFHTYYEEENNIDYLYLGSSHVYNGINPYRLDEINGGNNFSLGTSAQLLNASYHLLVEADKDHELKHVFLEMYYSISTGEEYATRIWNNWRVTDFMKPSRNKLELMLSLNGAENYIETVLPFIRYRSKLFDAEHICNNIDNKSSEMYKKYQYETKNSLGNVSFYGKGFCKREWSLEESNLIMGQTSLSEEPILPEAEIYLRKIIEYCQENNIKITLYSAPMYELQLLSINDYDRYVKQVNSIAREYGIAYYDFNLCKEEILPIQGVQYFYDIGHMNYKGTELFTDVFWYIMQGTPENNRDFFYQTYAEYKENTDERIYGVLNAKVENPVAGIEYFRVASNKENSMEYRIVLTPDDGDSVMFQDFSDNTIFYMPVDDKGICTIVARNKSNPEKIQTIEIEY